MDINCVDYICKDCDVEYQLLHDVKECAVYCPFCGSEEIKVQ